MKITVTAIDAVTGEWFDAGTFTDQTLLDNWRYETENDARSEGITLEFTYQEEN